LKRFENRAVIATVQFQRHTFTWAKLQEPEALIESMPQFSEMTPLPNTFTKHREYYVIAYG
jgi:hypothetical protein